MRISDWSSDVCSSDLIDPRAGLEIAEVDRLRDQIGGPACVATPDARALKHAAETVAAGEGRGQIDDRAFGGRCERGDQIGRGHPPPGDRKSTRLNSSH